MNDNDIINDYNPKLDPTNPNLKYIDKFPDWAQTANDDTKMGEAHDSMTEIVAKDEYFQRKIKEAMSPSAAEINPKIRMAQAPMPRKLTPDEVLQRKIEEAMSPGAAEINPEEIADLDDSIYRRR